MQHRPDDRGRHADTPAAMPARGWKDVLKRTWRETSDDNIGLVAAGAAFYLFLSIAPVLAAIVLSYGLFADRATVMANVRQLGQVLPPDAAGLIAEQLLQVSQGAEGKQGLGFALAILLAVYGAMKGASAMMTAMNIAYDEAEERGFVARNLTAFGITAGAVLAAIAGLFAASMIGYVDRWLADAPAIVHFAVRAGSWTLAAAIACFVIAAIYRYGPSRAPAKWRWLSVGAIAATLLWLLATVLSGLYVASFADYNATYGSLGAVVGLLMWLYVSAYVVLLGAELNAELEHQTGRDTTTGPEKPLGQRDAVMADQVAPTPA